MIKSLISLCFFRTCIFWQHSMKFHGNGLGIFHNILGTSRMNIYAMYYHLCAGCIEVFKLDLSFMASIQRITVNCPEFRNLQIVCPSAYLFIRCEGDADFSMRDLVSHQFFCSCKNFCNSCFIICTQKCSSICCNQCSSLICF